MTTYVLNGTNQVIPMNGTNQVVPMNGTNQVIPMNGTNQVVPMVMQGTYGTYEVHPHALVEYENVPMNGIPDDYDERDCHAYRVAYMVGDPDAVNGLFGKLKSKIKQAVAGNKDARNNRRADRSERQEERKENRAIRQQKRADGTSFLDKFGGAISNVGEAFKLKSATAAALDDNGIEYDDEILEQRSAMATDGGMDDSGSGDGSSGGIMEQFKEFWNAGPVQKAAVVGVGLGLAYGIGRATGVISPPKKSKK